MDKIRLLKTAIEKAEQGQSKLKYTNALELQGFTGYKVKHLLNNIGEFVSNGFEIGCHKGSMTVAVNYENKLNYFVCDNWSQFDEGGGSKKMFYETIDEYNIRCNVLEQDCWTIDKKNLPKIDFFIFDGEHSYESQKKAFTHFKDVFADEFIVVVDDFGWDDVKRGTEDGIFESKMKILYQKQLGIDKQSDGDGFWNGIFVAVIKK